MADDGSGREVTSERILLEFLLTSDPAMFTSEVAANVSVSRQRVGQILNDLDEDGFVTSKRASGRRLWWLTRDGHQYIADVAREMLN